ncbi:MAG: phage tail tape measure protein, partial [Shewanella sp.]
QQQLTMLKEHQAELLDEKNAYYIALDAKQADWTNGARSSMENYIDAAADMAGQTERLMDNAFGGMTDALTDFVTTGKADFASLTKSILADIAKIAMQKAIAGFIGSMFGFAEGGVVGGSSASDYTGDAYQKWIKNGKSSGGYTGAGGKYEPAGIVHKGEVVWSQQDIARAGGVATVEAMRKGNKGYANGGIVGGAAYNGVPASATTGTSPNVIINQQIIVPESNNNNGANNTNMNEVIKAYAESSKQGTKTQIALELRPGGMIWRAMKGGY